MGSDLHMARDGKMTPIAELEDSHLLNIVRLHVRSAKEGVIVRAGGGSGSDHESYWYDEDYLYGEDALKYLKTYKYLLEALKRGLKLRE